MKRYKLEFEDRLSLQQAKEALKHMEVRAAHFARLESYYLGENVAIFRSSGRLARKPIPVAYGRRIVNTTVGYMFKPGYVGYSSENEPYKENLDAVQYESHEELVTTALGKNAAIFGVALELHWVGENTDGKTVPRFDSVDPKEVLAVYSYDIGNDELQAAIRWYEIGRDEYVDIYYPDAIVKYSKTRGGQLTEMETVPHAYGRVPVVEYENNQDRQGDYEPVLALIDAYDLLMSDMVHEIDKLAEAYLVLTNASLPEDDVDRIRHKRIIELMEGGKAEFLVKNVNAGFIQFMRDFIREEIHQQSQIPDMTDASFGGQQSGIAIRYKLNSLEAICTIKEALFQRGLYQRFARLDAIMDQLYGDIGGIGEIDITFTRDIPANYLEIAQIVAQLRGNVSLQTLLEQVVPFVTNAAEEIERLEAETDPYGFDTEVDDAGLDET